MLSGELPVKYADGIRASHPAVQQSHFIAVPCLALNKRPIKSIAADCRKQGADSAAEGQDMAASEVGVGHCRRPCVSMQAFGPAAPAGKVLMAVSKRRTLMGYPRQPGCLL